ncbi:methyltransferase family protein [Thermosporothrix hazakensis]|uniref:Methyltransferase family protein n=1 Tax=Thermosporothrix hazakensis TaxID=644383 RepID=A0A326U950_THEHA|nr:SAM-dependent methyltransferase [Thermosporothrix hazakensis]PZW31937.1 methyltransferase family protein [Thermosporothrix hazakensis]GCE49738.1 SAM-dependent methyltransferase [Thermosporothrix hazakensis]
MSETTYQATVREAIQDTEKFVRLTAKCAENVAGWQKIVMRPVLIKNARHMQFSYFDARKDITKNYRDEEFKQKLDEALALPLRHITLQLTDAQISIQITKKGKAIIHRQAVEQKQEVSLQHDRPKPQPLAEESARAFLQGVGIMNAQGNIKPDMRDKYYQVNEFLKMLEHTGEVEHLGKHGPVHILDCGCGSSYLTFSVYHYLNAVRRVPAQLVGVDINRELMEKNAALARELGWLNVSFIPSPIAEYQPEQRPDIVLSLHACDTATDDALAKGIQLGAKMILAVPCCHHDLNKQITANPPELFKPVLRYGILKERQADLLTDTFRALILRIMGYKTDVVEFISAEHTAKNLMIRAIRRAERGEAQFVEEYKALKAFWQVTPFLEKLLGEQFTRYL